MHEESELKSIGIELHPCEQPVDLSDVSRFTKLKLTQGQKMQINSLLGEIPSLITANTLSQTYVAVFPDGIPHALLQLGQGGVSSSYKVDGKFAGTASLYQTTSQAICLGAFSAMSIASGQYFLSEINSKMLVMKAGLDKILEFLYDDKRAELMAEISFARFAYQNYSSMMEHEAQRVATLTGLQNGRKVAMKDIEFYLEDLNSRSVAKDGADISEAVTKAIQIKECLELSMQLYAMSNLLEVFYAQNYDQTFLQYIEEDVLSYLNKCEKRMLTSFSMLQQALIGHKDKFFKKSGKDILTKQIGVIVEELNASERSPIHELLRSVLKAPQQRANYYLDANGEVYLQKS